MRRNKGLKKFKRPGGPLSVDSSKDTAGDFRSITIMYKIGQQHDGSDDFIHPKVDSRSIEVTCIVPI